MQTLAQDLRFGVRLLMRAPGFTLLAAGILALAIGALSAIFSLVDAALLRPLPFAKPDQLVMLWERPPGYAHNRISPLNYQDWHDQNRVFSSMAAVAGTFATVQTKDGPEQLTGQSVTAEFFSLLGVKPIAGRAFSPNDERTRADIVMVSERMWRSQFGSDPKFLGSTISVNGKPAEVVGIVPARFAILWKSDVWSLFTVKRSPEQRRMHYMQVLARLKPGISIELARAGMNVIANNIAQISPDTNKDWGITIEPLRAAILGPDLRVTSLVLLAVVAFVLLMACANIANLMLARGAGRSREIAVRAALGAGAPRITRQLLTESLVLSILGGLGGLALACVIVRVAPSMLPVGIIPAGLQVGIDPRVIGFSAGITLLSGILFGLAPAWQLGRTSVSAALQSSGSYTATVGNSKLLGGIAVMQVAVGVMVVAGAALLVRTLERLSNVDPGFHAERVLTMRMTLPLSRYPTQADAFTFYDSVEKEISALPGVVSVAFGGSLPTAGWDIGQSFQVVGDSPQLESESPAAHYQIVGSRYFETLGISFNAGRPFSEEDNASAPQVAIVNEEFVHRYLHGRPPLGKHLRVNAMDPSAAKMVDREIVGVINQVKVEGLGEKENAAEIYVPIAQNPWYGASLAIRTKGDPFSLLHAVKAVIARHDPELPVTEVRSMDDIAYESIAEPRFRARLLGSFAGLALSLSGLGVFGVLAFSVTQRRREFGVRMALGAQLRDVFALVLQRAGIILGLGLAIGILGAAASTRSMSALLYGVSPLDAASFMAAPAVLTLVVLAATCIPALRAMRTNPAVVLRHE